MLMAFSIVKISYFQWAKIRSFYNCKFFTHYFAFFFI